MEEPERTDNTRKEPRPRWMFQFSKPRPILDENGNPLTEQAIKPEAFWKNKPVGIDVTKLRRQ